MEIMNAIDRLLNYAEKNGLTEKSDRTWAANRLIDALGISEYIPSGDSEAGEIEETLAALCDYAAENGILADNTVTYRDLFDTKLMGLLTPRPSEVIRRFNEEYERSPEAATEYYYALSRATDYIRTYTKSFSNSRKSAESNGFLRIL